MKGIVVFVTTPPDISHSIAEKLVEERLAACVNIVPVSSIYFWKGKLEKDTEHFLVIKTREELYGRLKRKVEELHRYEIPEIVGIEMDRCNESYLKWIFESTEGNI
jgi:periplasmic divalent cation tolerance protein